MSSFSLRKVAPSFDTTDILKNILSGAVVGVVAIPLAMAFAIASGAKPEQGLYTSIVAGIAVSLFGGCKLQIAGPTGAFIVILAGINAKYGYNGLQAATLMAGVLLVLFGKFKFGAVIKFIPRPVIIGFTAGIAVIIWVGQWKDFFGLPAPSGEQFYKKLFSLLESFPLMNVPTTGLSLLALAILLLSPKVLKKIPSPLVAMVVVTVVQSVLKLDGVQTIGSAFGGVPSVFPMPRLPEISINEIFLLIGPAFTIALLGAIESMLSAVVADGMTNSKHNSNKELVGQGVANILCPLFGGFAATGAIARTATNIKNGATSRFSGVVHSLVVLAMVLFLAPLAGNIPLCALSAILFIVAYNMCEFERFVDICRAGPKSDIFILVFTFLLTILSDLVIAVNAGVALASLIFMARMSKAVRIEQDDDAMKIIYDGFKPGSHESAVFENGELDANCNESVLAYTISGPFFFAAAERIESVLSTIQAPFDTIILRFGNVPFIDATGVNVFRSILSKLEKHGKKTVLCNVHPYVMGKFEKAGIIALVGRTNIIDRIEQYACRYNERRKNPAARIDRRARTTIPLP
jgi:sulfate permease, SulP family